MLPKKITFIDIETTGVSLVRDRIIEVGLVVVENGRVVNTFQSLVDPQIRIPQEITSITGITQKDIESAPTFREVFEKIDDVFEDSIFVAHNVAFDFGFFKKECRQIGVHFNPKKMCTVKLSRTFFPQERKHNLDSIIQRFSFVCERRHRALDDANVLWNFYEELKKQFGVDSLHHAIAAQIKSPTLPKRLFSDSIEHMPTGPGVYIFYAENGAPLYIGKSTNIKSRVLSHFSNATRESKELRITDQIASLEWKETKGELGALLLENELIKSEQPMYNRLQRMKKKLYVLRKEKNEKGYLYAKLYETEKINSEDLSSIISVFKSKKHAESLLGEKAKQFGLCEKLLGLEKTKKECFLYRLGICKGACIGEENTVFYNTRFIEAFYEIAIKQWPFQSPILVKEQNESGQDLFVIDKWCVLGSISSYEYQQKFTEKNEIEFEYDVYKILQSYIFSLKNQSSITPISKEKVSEFVLIN